jgi:hypothetical protein
MINNGRACLSLALFCAEEFAEFFRLKDIPAEVLAHACRKKYQ